MKSLSRWAALALLTGAAAAQAQIPTEAQKEAIRASCRADYQRLCSSISPGGQASLSCLQRNLSALSGACQSAVGAIGRAPGSSSAPATRTAPATAAAETPAPGRGRFVAACGTDVQSFCRDIPPGQGRMLRCLRENGPSLSPGCRDSLASLAGR